MKPGTVNLALNEIHCGNALTLLRSIPDRSVQCCVTSPPYFGLRDYGDPRQIGMERTPEEYIEKLVVIFREVRRVLRDDGTLWLNIGDSYWGSQKGFGMDASQFSTKQASNAGSLGSLKEKPSTAGKSDTYKPKDLIGIPWMLAFALRADGWYLRQDIIWCLSGGTWVYARTQKGDMPIMVRDLARLKSETVQLWNGEKWTRLLGISRNKRTDTEIEIVLRSGERISCTPAHQFPTKRGLLRADEIHKGDCLTRVTLSEPEKPKDSAYVGLDAAWFAGLYLAEGSMSGDTIQIAGHAKEEKRWYDVQRIVESYGGTATRTVSGNSMDIRVYGKVLVALLSELISGRTAKNKCLASVCWRYSNEFLGAFLNGYLSGDGGWDEKSERWRLGFCRNYNLERDLRTLAARLNLHLTLKPTFAKMGERKFPSFRGEIRLERSGHWNEKDTCEVVEIRKARCRNTYDLGVEDEPHVFALASGILTHNSKPNSMPESVTDRCTKSHEYIFLLAKSPRYYYDQDAIREKLKPSSIARLSQPNLEEQEGSDRVPGKTNGNMKAVQQSWHGSSFDKGKTGNMKSTRGGVKPVRFGGDKQCPDTRLQSGKEWHPSQGGSGFTPEKRNTVGAETGTANKRSVWFVTTQGFKEAHFATFPPKLIIPCIKAGSPEGGIILDPFMGAGTTAMVAKKLGRQYIGIELNAAYIAIANKRLDALAPSLFDGESQSLDSRMIVDNGGVA